MPDHGRARATVFGVVLALFVAGFSLDYTVKRGDTLTKIAREHGVSLTDLIAANATPNPDLIHPGQILVIPGSAKPTPAPEVTHVVRAGDTLARIANSYGTTATAIANANGISNVNLIRSGQKLIIPAATSAGGGSGGASDPSVRTNRHHVVKPGENLASIAAQYAGVSSDQIVRANGVMGGVIFSGTRLFLDGPVYQGPGGSKTTYTVKSGDRLGDIALAHNVSAASIVELNGISNPNLIRVGQELVINTAGWVCPVQGATFFNDWGFPRAGGRFHEGNDLFAKHGTPVRASVSGTVSQVTGVIGGKQFNLTGDDGVFYLGSHLSDFGKSGKVNAGDVIGYVGTTGNATGSSPHLHFGMYINGAVINPYPTLISQGCR